MRKIFSNGMSMHGVKEKKRRGKWVIVSCRFCSCGFVITFGSKSTAVYLSHAQL